MTGISIIISYYKGENYILRCINSILDSHKKADSKLNYEIIVQIDSMEDGDYIRELLKNEYYNNPQIIINKNKENLGVAKSRNNGLKFARYNFFTVIDQDDYVSENYFQVIEKKIKDDIAVFILNGRVKYEKEGFEIPIFYFKPKFLLKNIVLQTTIIYAPGLIIFNKLLIKTTDIYKEASTNYKGSDDWAAYIEILTNNISMLKYIYIKDKIFTYCLHSTNYSNNKREMLLSSKSSLEYILTKNLTITDRRIIDFGRKRYDFLYKMKYSQYSVQKILKEHFFEFLFHYATSFKHTDRLNRLIYRLMKIYKYKLHS